MRHRRASYLFLPLALLAGIGARAEEKPEKVFVGYVYGSTQGIDFDLYTHLCHAFLTADAEGKVNADRGVPNRMLTAAAHEKGVKVLLSLGGWGWDEQFAAITADPARQERYVAAVMEAVEKGDYDGLDVDWEYPDNEEDVVGFEGLVRALRARLDEREKATGRPMLVTMAASSNEGTLRWLNKDFLLETMDWVNVMTYDMAGDWTDYAGHNAPLFASSREPGRRGHSTARVVEYLLDDLRWPADHVALGIPLYGRGFAVKEPYASTKMAPRMPRGEGGRYSRIAEMLAGPGWKRVFDDETKVPWLIADDGHAVIGYDDAESTTIKGAWARSKGLRGVFFWEVAGDRMPDGSHPLQEAARRGLFDGEATPSKITSER